MITPIEQEAIAQIITERDEAAICFEQAREALAKAERERDKARADCAQLVADYGERGDLLAECRVRVSELEALLAKAETERDDANAYSVALKKISDARYQYNVALEAQLAECETALGDCATDISEWVEAHYAKIKHYPSEKRRYERDMVSVDRARALLAKLKAHTS